MLDKNNEKGATGCGTPLFLGDTAQNPENGLCVVSLLYFLCNLLCQNNRQLYFSLGFANVSRTAVLYNYLHLVQLVSRKLGRNFAALGLYALQLIGKLGQPAVRTVCV